MAVKINILDVLQHILRINLAKNEYMEVGKFIPSTKLYITMHPNAYLEIQQFFSLITDGEYVLGSTFSGMEVFLSKYMQSDNFAISKHKPSLIEHNDDNNLKEK